MTKGKALLGVLAGLAAGAAIGLLLAPEKGERTRRKIGRKGRDFADAIHDKIEDKFADLLDSLSDKMKRPAVHRDLSSDKTL